MWKLCTILTALTSLILASAKAEQNNEYSEYSASPSNRVSYYYYPAPPKSRQLNDPTARQLSTIATPVAPQRTVVSAAQPYRNQYQYYGNYRRVSAITKQFVSPALDNAAFNLALTNQGYMIVNAPAVNAALIANSKSNKPVVIRKSLLPVSPSSTSEPASSLTPTLASLNVKLPLPLGITPLNIAPLPLQAGAPYTTLPNVVTSYGTPYPQRKRR